LCRNSNTTGNYNNFHFGAFAGCSNNTGVHNNFFGAFAIGRCETSTGEQNNCFGYFAGFANTFNGNCNTTDVLITSLVVRLDVLWMV
jgi:hypothetical protein